jgi:membrane-associated protease RseP (regulator of RpoE activity)
MTDEPDQDPTAPDDPTTEDEAAAPAPASKARHTITLPKWTAGALAGLVLLGAGFGIGWAVSPDDDGDHHHGSDHGAESGMSEHDGPGMSEHDGRDMPGLPGPGGQGMPGYPGGRQMPHGDDGAPHDAGGAYLGVAVESTDDGAGARITAVEDGSPADEAGLKEGDVVTAVDGDEITGATDLARAIVSRDGGDKVTITYTRDAKSSKADVKLGSRSSDDEDDEDDDDDDESTSDSATN